MKQIVLVAGSLLLLALMISSRPAAAASLTVNGAQQFQTIDGFGVNINVNSWNGGKLRPALDLLVNQLGATLWRVVIDNADWEATNDNADPQTFNWAYYNGVYTSAKFEELWSTIAYLNQQGVTSGIILNFMGPVSAWMGGSRINVSAEDEWVEMIASLVYYARVTRSLQFGFLGPMNEPDWDGIEGPQVDQWQYVRLLRKLARKLNSLGLSSLSLVGPDTASISTGVNAYMPEMMTDSVVMAKVQHFGFHNYAGDSGGADAAIKASAYPTRNFWITEVSNIWDILTHLRQGPAAALVWDAYDSVYNHAILAGRGSTPPNDVGNGPPLLSYNTTSRTYTPRKAFYEMAQLFKFVSPGARRIGASTPNSNLTVYAFHHPVTGRLTIVGRSTASSNVVLNSSLLNLPALSSLQFYETNGSVNLRRRSDVSVAAGSFSVTVSPNSVFTLTAAGTAPSMVTLTVARAGTGSGTVTSSPAGITCGNDCTESLSSGTVVTLTATPAAGAVLGGWSGGGCTGTGTCVVTLSAATTVTATFAPAPASVTLTVARAGTGSGTVTSSPAGITCGSDCTENLPSGTVVTLTATPAAGAVLGGWAGGGCTGTGTCVVTLSAATTVTATFNGVSPSTGLVAAFAFNEGTGTVVANAVGTGLGGTVSGATWITTGKYGRALTFDGVNDLVTVNDAAALDLTNGMTLSAWVYPTALSAWRTVLLKERPGGLVYALYGSDATSRPSSYINVAGVDREATGSASLALNTWTHLAVTYNGATLRLYVNGVQAASRAVSGTLLNSTGALRIGGNNIWGEWFQGRIDEVRIYNRRQTATELQTDMNTAVLQTDMNTAAGSSPPPPGQPALRIVTGSELSDQLAVQGFSDDGTAGLAIMPYGPATVADGVYVAIGQVNSTTNPDIVTGTGSGPVAEVRVFRADGSDIGLRLKPYTSTFFGGVRVASCDIDGDGMAEIITAPGPGRAPTVRVYRLSGTTALRIASFNVNTSTVTNGVFVACGDIDGDGLAEVVSGLDTDSAPEVRIYRVAVTVAGTTVTRLVTFKAYASTFTGGVRVTTADVDGDGVAEVVTAMGPGGQPRVRVFKLTGSIISQLTAFSADEFPAGGLYVAGAGRDSTIGGARILVAPGLGGVPQVYVYAVSESQAVELTSFPVGDPTSTVGVTVGAAQ